jgi:ATP-binding cassette subfamily C protein
VVKLKEKIAGSTELLGKLWFLARPYGLLKPSFVLFVILLQGVLQVAGVTSIFPFLALASDPNAFRASGIGLAVLRHLPAMDDAILLTWAGALSVVVLVLSNAANLLSDYVRARYAHGLGHWLRLRLLEQMVSRPWGYFLTQNTGVLIKKASNDVINMVHFVLLPLLEGIARLVTAVLLIFTLLLINFTVAATAALVLGFYYAVVFKLLQVSRRGLSHAWREADRGAIREVQQLLGGVKTVKLHHAERYFVDRFARHSLVQAQVNSKTPLHYHAPKYILEPFAFGGLILVVLLYAAAGRSLSHVIPILGVVGLAGYRLLPAVQLLYAQISQIGTSRHTLDEVYEEFHSLAVFQDGSERKVLEPAPKPLALRTSIILDDVSFRYGGAPKETLHGIRLEIPRKSSLGIVGVTGSGKSTLVDLLMGLHQPTSGRILVDGVPLTEENIRSWQAGIGYVPQDIFLIDDTIARNIAMGVPDREIDAARLREAAAAASILTFIEDELPGQFDATVGERGVRLSGGQRQRIALARAIYRRPELLILDEATSALDNETESQVVDAISKLEGEITMVVIAHRLSTIEKCQMIVELTGGHLVRRA